MTSIFYNQYHCSEPPPKGCCAMSIFCMWYPEPKMTLPGSQVSCIYPSMLILLQATKDKHPHAFTSMLIDVLTCSFTPPSDPT